MESLNPSIKTKTISNSTPITSTPNTNMKSTDGGIQSLFSRQKRDQMEDKFTKSLNNKIFFNRILFIMNNYIF